MMGVTNYVVVKAVDVMDEVIAIYGMRNVI